MNEGIYPVTCEGCRFWDAGPIKGSLTGKCRRHPPVFWRDNPGVEDEFGYWPITDCEDWCGEFQPKAVPDGR